MNQATVTAPDAALSPNSSLMVDKITTIWRSKLGQRLGSLEDSDLIRLNRAVVVFLGVAGTT
jgi:mRNA interferase MazF